MNQMAVKPNPKESDLYPPLKAFLEGQGYEVKGEIQNCDVVATRKDEEPVIVELKLSLNLTVLLQAVDRLGISDLVYLCVPKRIQALRSNRRRILKLVRMLGIGLIVVDLEARNRFVEIINDPSEYKPRKNKRRKQRLLKEFAERAGDTEDGGTAMRQGLLTAYRQRAIAVADLLLTDGPMKASHIADTTGDPKARGILYRNVYGWFDRQGKGVYALSPRGEAEVPDWIKRLN